MTFNGEKHEYNVNCMTNMDPKFPRLYQERYAAIHEWYLRAKQRVTAEYDLGRIIVEPPPTMTSPGCPAFFTTS
jgi:hypothetical protein